MMKEYDKAIELHKKVISMNPGNYEAWINIGEVYLNQGMFKEALEYYQKCEKVSKDLSDWPAYWAIYIQGVIAYQNGDKKTAEDLFSRA